MLYYMRQHSRSAIIYIFFGIIITVFIISFGPQSQGCEPSQIATIAKVDGEAIDSIDLRAEYVRHFGTVSGRDVDDDAYLAQRRETLDGIINSLLLAGEARRLGLVVTPAELASFIKDPERNPDYRSLEVDGQFNAEQYQRLVTAFLQTTMERYERIRGWELQARKLVDYYKSLITVSDAELQDAYREKETKVNLHFAAVRPADQQIDEQVDPSQVQSYALAHKDEVQKYYEGHKADFDQPRQVKIRQIFLKSEAADPPEQRAAVKARAEELRTRIVAGEDMAGLATELSEHVSYQAKGGDMGWQSQGNADPAFDAAAFALQQGELSGVVETPTGYYLLRAEEIREALKRTVEEATDEIARTLILEERRKAEAKKQADGILAAMQGGRSFEDAIRTVAAAPAAGDEDAGEQGELRYSIEETGDFTQEGRGGAPDMANIFAFTKSWDQVPRIGRSREVALAAFALSTEQPVPAQTFEVNGTWYVLKLKSRTEPPAEIPEATRTALRTELQQSKESKLLGNWEAALFYPSARRMFGPQPSLGPVLQDLLTRLRNESAPDILDPQLRAVTVAPREASADDVNVQLQKALQQIQLTPGAGGEVNVVPAPPAPAAPADNP